MNASALATALLGRRVRLTATPADLRAVEGVIVTVYLDTDGMHYVVLVDGRLVHATADDLTVLEHPNW
jgi:hypothetical protein